MRLIFARLVGRINESGTAAQKGSMTNVDPGIASDDSTTTKIDSSEKKTPWWRTPRWAKYGGHKPPMTLERIEAISDKRTWEKRVKSRAHYASATELAALGMKPHPIDLDVIAAAAPDTAHLLAERHVRVLAVLAAALVGFQRDGVIASQEALGALIGLRRRQTAKAVAELRAWGLITSFPTYKQHGGPVHSRRGNGYELGAALVAALNARRGRNAVHSKSSSGVHGNPETSPSKSEKTLKLSGTAVQSRETGGVVSPAAPATIDFPSAVPAVGPDVAGPATREAASTGTVQKAPDRGGRVTSIAEVLGELAEALPDVVRWLRGGSS